MYTFAVLTCLATRHIQSSGHNPEDQLIARNTRKLALIAAALAALVLAATVLINASPSSAEPSLDPDEQAFLTLINNYRAQNGLNALVPQDDLNQASDWYVTDMTTKDYYGGDQYCAALNPPKPAHCDSLGRDPGQRMVAFGYPIHQTVGENLAAGFSSAQAVFNGWKNSPGHNTNMLRTFWTAIGIGKSCNASAYYGCYWVTDFGTYTGPDNPNPSMTASPLPTQQPTPPPTIAPTPTQTPGPTQTSTPVPTGPTQPPTDTPVPTETPTPTPRANLIWDDVNCDGFITAEDAVAVLRGGIGFSAESSRCPAVWDLLKLGDAYRVWGDTDCSLGVQVLDAVKLLAYLSSVSFDVKPNCPPPGTRF